MRVNDKGYAYDVPVPAGELEAVAAPTQVRAHHDDLAVVGQINPFRIAPCQQHLVYLHDPVDAFVIDQLVAVFAQQAVQDRRNPPIAIGRALCDQIPDQWNNRRVLHFMVAPPRICGSLDPFDQIKARDAERSGNRLHRKSSLCSDADSKVGFFDCDLAKASFRISTSMVLRPRRRSSSRTRSSSLRTS